MQPPKTALAALPPGPAVFRGWTRAAERPSGGVTGTLWRKGVATLRAHAPEGTGSAWWESGGRLQEAADGIDIEELPLPEARGGDQLGVGPAASASNGFIRAHGPADVEGDAGAALAGFPSLDQDQGPSFPGRMRRLACPSAPRSPPSETGLPASLWVAEAHLQGWEGRDDHPPDPSKQRPLGV
eukprot:evm.model.scf_465EXC.4 EVM.evm.TU.scf_465EXC.4   scf_465EXC:47313-48042(+)